jgi:hypothetical protein
MKETLNNLLEEDKYIVNQETSNSKPLIVNNNKEVSIFIIIVIIVLSFILYGKLSEIVAISLSSLFKGGRNFVFLIPIVLFFLVLRVFLIMIWDLINSEKIIISKEILLERSIFYFLKIKIKFNIDDFILKKSIEIKKGTKNYKVELLKKSNSHLNNWYLLLFSTTNEKEFFDYIKELEEEYPHIYQKLSSKNIKKKIKIISIIITTLISIILLELIVYSTPLEINGITYSYGKPYNGTLVRYYDGGDEKLVLSFIDGKLRDYESTYWYKNGGKKEKFTYEDDKLIKSMKWYKNEEQKEELIYKNGKLIISKRWSEEGKLLK